MQSTRNCSIGGGGARGRSTPFVQAFVEFLLCPPWERGRTNCATFPADFDKFVLSASYDRGSSKEEAFALPETIELSKSGKPLPVGTPFGEPFPPVPQIKRADSEMGLANVGMDRSTRRSWR